MTLTANQQKGIRLQLARVAYKSTPTDWPEKKAGQFADKAAAAMLETLLACYRWEATGK